MNEIRDEFLSEEDLDLRTCSDQELYAWWDQWLRLAQASNETDKDTYSHGVFMLIGERRPMLQESPDSGAVPACGKRGLKP